MCSRGWWVREGKGGRLLGGTAGGNRRGRASLPPLYPGDNGGAPVNMEERRDWRKEMKATEKKDRKQKIK